MIVKTVSIKVFGARNKKSYTYVVKAGAHQQFTEAGIEQILAKYAEQIEVLFPDKYRLVQIGPGQFNFVHKG